MRERAARWVRVSTGRQDERSQEPDIRAWCDSHGYDVVKEFTLHDVSAYKGQQDAAQREVVESVRRGEFTVVVAWVADRVERRGVEELLRFAREVREAGGRLEFSNDPLANSFEHLGDIGPAMAAWAAQQESKRKSERVRSVNEVIDAAGGYRGGRVPFGYKVAGTKRAKALVPDEARSAIVMEIFRRVAAGQPLPVVLAWMAAEHEVVRVNSSSLTKLVRNEIYWTGRYEIADHAGVTRVHRTRPVVSPELWRAANYDLNARQGAGPRSKPRLPRKPDYSGAVFCAACGRPAYRNSAPSKRSPDGKRSRRRTYWCAACHIGWDAGKADAKAEAILLHDTDPEMTIVFIPGDDHSAELERVKAELRDLAARELPEDEEDAERARLRSERKRLEGLPAVPPRREFAPTGRTRGQAFDAMTHPERVAYMRSGEFVVMLSGRGHGVEVERVWLDDAAT